MKESTGVAAMLGLIFGPVAVLLIDATAQLVFGESLIHSVSMQRIWFVVLWTFGSTAVAGFAALVMARVYARIASEKPPQSQQHDDVRHRATLDVVNERVRQIRSEGYSTTHDDYHDAGELAMAASAYALAAADKLYPYSQGDGDFDSAPPKMWPDGWQWKPKEPRRALVCSAALAIAEIERIDRKGEA